ncbi:serine hydrolase [Vulcanococcus sp.]|jgi:beta-lactamase class A|uniref:serine hydrolase n=1 Tax=Vulcanococcus sp. TaxID=2856995 RepID=UPI003BFDEAC3
MAFYCPDGAMAQQLEGAIAALEADGRPGLGEQLSVSWIRYESSLRHGGGALASAQGSSWRGGQVRYPASVVKLLYLVAAEAWLQRQLIEESPELRRALADMIRDSSNDATGLVVDLLTGTCSGPELPAEAFALWSEQRQLINDWFASLGWPQWQDCNACQKTWGDGPYGRERQSYGAQLENRNRLSTDLTARVLQAVMAGDLVSPPACGRMQELLSRSLDAAERSADPENQVDGFVGGGLPAEARLWSKAGWMSQARHDAAYIEVPEQRPMLLVVFSEGAERAKDEGLLPALTQRLLQS